MENWIVSGVPLSGTKTEHQNPAPGMPHSFQTIRNLGSGQPWNGESLSAFQRNQVGPEVETITFRLKIWNLFSGTPEKELTRESKGNILWLKWPSNTIYEL